MRVARYRLGGRAGLGLIGDGTDGQPVVTPISGPTHERWKVIGAPVPLSSVKLLAPALPTKIVGFGQNYRVWIDPQRRKALAEPYLFLKPPSSLIGPGDTITVPDDAMGALHEAVLTIVMGRRARRVRSEDAADYIAGYTCGNDITAVDIPPSVGNDLSRTKAYDTFCPLGPWLETELDPSDLVVECRVAGERRQRARTSGFVRSAAELVELVSAVMTLNPGDLVMCGTSRDYGLVTAGENVSVRIDGIGTLTNPVRHRTGQRPSSRSSVPATATR